MVIAAANAAAASHDVVDEFAGLIALSATTRKVALSQILHPGEAIRRPKRAPDMNDHGAPFDPGNRAKWRRHPPILRRAAAVRRHAVCSAAAQADIAKQIRYITGMDTIVTWLDLIMGHQYGPRGF
jgi:hypothetical protein